MNSPELQAQLRQQRDAIAATRDVAQRERAPLALRISRQSRAVRSRRRLPALGLGLAATAGALLWTAIGVGGGEAGLTLAQASAFAARPAAVAVREPRDEEATLPGLRAAGLPFPYWEDHFAWDATGARSDVVHGRTLTTVFYRRGAASIAYTIVSGGHLAPGSGARSVIRAGTSVTVYPSAGARTVVTWLRRGHTCVLSGRGIPSGELVRLATWRGSGRIPY